MFNITTKRFVIPIVSAILLSCAWVSAPGQEISPRTLNLEESINIALAENLTVKSAEAGLEIAKQKVNEARAGFMPVLSATGSYTYFGELPTMDIDFDLSAFGLSPELMQMMGMDTPPADEESKSGGIPVGSVDTYSAGLSLQQPLFTWGKIYNNYKQAKISMEASQQAYEAAKRQVTLDVTKAFYGVLLTEKLVNVAEKAVSQVEAHVKVAQDLLDAGMATDFDLLRAKVQLANFKSLLIRARNGLTLSKDSFKNTIGMDLNAQINVAGELVYKPLDLDLDQLIESAMANRPEIKQLKLQEQVGKKYISLAKAGNKPNLALLGNYNLESNADKMGDVFDRDEWNKNWNIILALQVPIFDGLATRARVKQAENGLEQIRIGMEQLTDGVGLEVRAAFLGLRESEELLKVQAETVQQAEESLRIANLRHKNGMITSVELMDTELAFTQAQTNQFNALHDYVIAVAKLEKASASNLD